MIMAKNSFAVFLIMILMMLFTLTASGGPAPWYKFKSKVTGKVECLQTSPGPGWEKLPGSYKDSHCTKRN
jgi:hypothetical protein